VAKRMVRRASDGTFTIRIGEEEREVIGALAEQLRELLLSEQTEGLERLFPPGYANDPDRDQEYQQLTHDELLTKRLDSIDVVERTIEATSLTEDELNAWMGAVNDLRLVLGTRLDVTEDMDHIELDDERGYAYHLYQYLTYVLSEILEAVSTY